MNKEYIVYNEYTLINRGIDSVFKNRQQALSRLKKIIKAYLNEWKKDEISKYKSEEDKYLWEIMSTELSFKKLDKIYHMVETIYNIDLKSMVYIKEV